MLTNSAKFCAPDFRLTAEITFTTVLYFVANLSAIVRYECQSLINDRTWSSRSVSVDTGD